MVPSYAQCRSGLWRMPVQRRARGHVEGWNGPPRREPTCRSCKLSQPPRRMLVCWARWREIGVADSHSAWRAGHLDVVVPTDGRLKPVQASANGP